MQKDLKNAKLINDPLWGLIDITDYLPMIDVPQFQALGFKYQLGVTSMLFPSATHTRKQHCLGAFRRTQQLTDRWLRRGFINNKEARLLEGFALWHDIGHGPFSHVAEEVTKEFYGSDHDEHGAQIIDNLRYAAEAANLNFDELKKLFTHENQLYLAVHDKNLGTEKLDYLSRDAYYTLGETPGVEYLANHTYFIENKIVIDEKAIDQAKAIQEFYVKMYKNVYLRKNSTIAQRLIQKMILELLREIKMSEDDFWALTDFGLLGLFETSENNSVRQYYQRFIRRDLPKNAIAIRSEKFAFIEEIAHKPQNIFGVAEDVMQKLISSERFATPSKLEVLERDIEKLASLPANSILVVPPTSVARFVPKDINIYMTGGKIATLSNYFEDHFKALEEEGRSYVVMRVCVFEENRLALSEPAIAQKIKDYILSLV